MQPWPQVLLPVPVQLVRESLTSCHFRTLHTTQTWLLTLVDASSHASGHCLSVPGQPRSASRQAERAEWNRLTESGQLLRPGTNPVRSILIGNGIEVRSSSRWIPVGAYDRVGPSISYV